MAHSVALIIAAEQKAAADAIAVALGHAPSGEETYVAPLSPSGTAPPTHFGCHTWAADPFIAMLSAAQWPSIPGVDAESSNAVKASLHYRVASIDDYETNFSTLSLSLGLQIIISEMLP